MTRDEIEALCAEWEQAVSAGHIDAPVITEDSVWALHRALKAGQSCAAALRAIARENEALRKERAFIAEHGGRIQKRACEWDKHGKVVAHDVLTWNFDPRRSTAFAESFATFDEALAHLMAQATAIDAARAGETTR